MQLKNRHAVVTGGASGIGRALCRRFAKEGARAVVVADVNEEGARAVASEFGGLGLGVDVSNDVQVRGLVERAERENGPIDLFFSNAGIGTPGGVEVSDEGWQRIWEINVMSHIYAARAVLPKMIGRGHGYICSTASAAGLLTQIGSAPYSLTKHAAVALAEWLAINHGDEGIRVSVLCPQAVRSKLTEGNEGGIASVDGMLEPEEVAETVVQAIEREEFLILPHPQVLTYMRRKTSDYERWLRGMRRFQADWRARQNAED